MWHILTMEYYSALISKEILTHGTRWMNRDDIILSEINLSQKTQILYDSIYIRSLEQWNSYRQKVEHLLSGSGEWRNWELMFNDTEFQFGMMKNSRGG